MPIPLPGESRDDFIDRCIPIVIEDGTAEDGSQAFAVCNSLFDEPKQGIIAPPVNERGWTAEQTIEQVPQQGRQFTKEEAGYMQPADLENAAMHCSLCNFYAGVDGAGVQHCNVVSGGIEWFAHSDLFINAEQQQAITRENAGAVEDDMDKQIEAGTMEHKTLPFIVTKVDDEKGIVTHTVAVMGNVDLGGDVIHLGSFTKTINERMMDIRVLDSHRTGSIKDVIGKPLTMREISGVDLPMQVKEQFPEATGALMAETQFLLNTENGREIFERIKAKAVNQYSIGYEAMDFDFEEREVDGIKQTIRNLRTIKLYEYSPVIFAMNPATSTVGVKDDSAASPQEKAALAIYNEKRNLSEIVKRVHIAFYTQHPDTRDDVFWVKEVHDEFLVVDQEGRSTATWKIGYTDSNGVINFTPRTEWEQGARVFVVGAQDATIDRAINAADIGLMQTKIDGIQAALSNLEEMLQSAPEQADMHEDEEKGEWVPEVMDDGTLVFRGDNFINTGSIQSESHQEPPKEAGPDVEPPTSKRDELLAELNQHLAEIEQMEVT